MKSEAPEHRDETPALETASTAGVPLSEVVPGQSVTIVSVDSDAPQGRRLLDLGFLPDTVVRVVRRAPLGDPIQFEIRGCHLCLRKTEADGIRVRSE